MRQFFKRNWLSFLSVGLLLSFLVGMTGAFAVAAKSKQVTFVTYDVVNRYYHHVRGYCELNLKLPRLIGDYPGIPRINEYFKNKEEFFYNQLPWSPSQDWGTPEDDEWPDEGIGSGWFRSAHYNLEVILGSIISISASLDGSAGGVGWAGIEGNTFDLNTGKKWTLSDVFNAKESVYMDFVYDYLSQTMAENIEDSLAKGYGSPYWFDDPYSGSGYETIRDRFYPENFYLTRNGMVIFYEKYDLTAGAGGPQVFYIPYDAVMDMLSPAIKEFIIPLKPVPTEPSFTVKETYAPYSWIAPLLLSHKAVKIEERDEWPSWRKEKVLCVPVGTVIACEWEESLFTMQVRDLDSGRPLSDWEYEVIMTEEMVGKHLSLAFSPPTPYSFVGYGWAIRVEESMESVEIPPNEDGAIPTPDDDAETDVILETTVTHPPTEGSDATEPSAGSPSVFVFIIGLLAGAALASGGFFMWIKRKNSVGNTDVDLTPPADV